ncbi:hypothetical protein MEQU1_001061 [Malassezia equina]|uniref:Inner centromere protein ARK-binding domain-containing protein n=1 Tax=Malassezia equina TaxID=1381935 RepID=A0AAF0ECZ3_9BASI|nr:hypothetical protein MEQU1_001061 [Malassezia equina]
MRNAYVVAQSQLLQLAKQMEFDADLSVWEEEASEKMQEFWEQSHQNVSEFCARVQYVSTSHRSSSMDPLPSLAADVVKSPRKKLESTMVTAVPSAPPSPTPAPRIAVEDKAAASLPVPTEKTAAPPTVPDPKPDSCAPEPETEPEAPPHEAEKPAAPPSVSPEPPVPLPSTTPGNALRTKRTLGTAVLRSTKKPDTTDEPRPPLRPPARFRSSFLNKSLRHAMEEKQAGSSDRDMDDSGHEPSRWDASPRAEPSLDRTEPRAVPGPSLDALRTRLESVRRASTTPATTALSSFPAERRASTLARPPSDTPSKLPPADLGIHGRSSRESSDERRASPAPEPASTKEEHPPQAAESTVVAPTHTASSVHHEPAVTKATGRTESVAATLTAHADPVPSGTEARSAPAPAAAPTEPARPASRASPSRPPSKLASSTTAAANRSPGRERPVARPMRPRTPGASPLRPGKVGTGAAPPFVPPATPTPATNTASMRGPNATRSPGRLPEQKLSPFRVSTKEDSPIRSRLPVSPARMGASKIPSPVRKPVPPVLMRAPSPEMGTASRTMPARPASVADVRSTAPGLGARIKGLLGLSAPSKDEASRPVSPSTRGSDGDEGPVLMPGSFEEGDAAPVRPLSMSTSAVPVAVPKRTSHAGSTPLRPAPLPKKGVPVRPLARPGSTVRVSSATRPAYTYDTEGKRRKLSQRPLNESTNVEERASTEDALKSKLTTAQGHVRTSTQTVRVSSSTARNAPTVSRPWTTTQRSSTLSTQNVFQQAAPPAPSADEEELPDVASEYSDSDDEASIRKRSQEPSWTRGRELEALLLQQATVDPDEIFGCQVGPVPLDTMLPPRKGDRRRMRHRTSSANWSGPDGLAQWEIDRYNERMGIHSARADP